MALLSGTFANRPTNMDASFGGANNGIIYFATDTGHSYRWNGAAWVDVTSKFNPNSGKTAFEVKVFGDNGRTLQFFGPSTGNTLSGLQGSNPGFAAGIYKICCYTYVTSIVGGPTGTYQHQFYVQDQGQIYNFFSGPVMFLNNHNSLNSEIIVHVDANSFLLGGCTCTITNNGELFCTEYTEIWRLL